MQLRDYQQRAIDQLYDWFRANPEGNPCLVLPTGAGKSHIVAALCKNALQSWPDTRVLMLTHQKELIEQNAEKLRQHWPGAPMGIYSASVGKRQAGEPITFAGIQSVRSKPHLFGRIDLVIIDECHTVSHKDEGGYRTFISALSEVNPALRVVGLTATPYRLGHGYITDKPAIFDALIEPVSIEELVLQGHLCILRSKSTSATLSVDGVKKRGGEYIESELQAAVNTDPQNAAVVQEVLARADAENRKAMLFFCTGLDHSLAIRDLLRKHGQTAECVTGKTPKAERARILQDFKAGKIRCLTNANVLSTGFDAPNIDLIAMLRPTMSPGLYLQMVGRALRVHPGKDYAIVLDFAGVVAMHGPVTAVQPPKRKGEPGGGEAPTKGCPECGELIHASVMTCPACGHVFEQKEKPLVLRNDDIMGIEAQAMHVTQWNWRKHTSRSSGKDMLAVTYYGALSDIPVTEYLPVCHDGFAGQKAMRQLVTMERQSGAAIGGTIADDDFLDGAALALNQSRPPAQIEYRRDGKFFRVLTRRWEHAPQAGMPN